MNMIVSTEEAKKSYYPTPPALADKLVEGLDLSDFSASILEPSAGSGNLIMALAPIISKTKNKYWRPKIEIDCCEIDPALRGILTENFSENAEDLIKEAINSINEKSENDPEQGELLGKLYEHRELLANVNVRIVHDDFLSFKTAIPYQIILMNPPFHDGDAHLLKAIAMQERYGGIIRCILNAETIRNPYSARRKVLVQKLEELGAEITFEKNAFQDADRSTNVEVAIIKIDIPSPVMESEFWKRCEKAVKQDEPTQETPMDLVLPDIVKQFIARYRMEVDAGCRLINEYIALQPYILEKAEDGCEYNKPIIGLAIDSDHVNRNSRPSINAYTQKVRLKYWNLLFTRKEFVGQLTSNLRNLLYKRVREMANYEFSEYNIRTIMTEMNAAMVEGIQETILNLFEDLTVKYSYNNEFGKNIWYFNGWKTNKAWKIGKKVILPGSVFPFYSLSSQTFQVHTAYEKLIDIEKALNYLDGHMTENVDLESQLIRANRAKITRNIQCKYFNVTFYKKGTIHIIFTCPELIDRFNIFCARARKWLPPSYGHVSYKSMSAEEKTVIDSFHGDGTENSGADNYQKVVARSSYYLAPPNNSTPSLEASA